MKKQATKHLFTALLTGMILLEMWLVLGLLPYRWSHSLERRTQTPQGAPDYSQITHPDIDGEIELMMREHPLTRLTVDTVLVGFIVVNTFGISRIWKIRQRYV